MRNKNSLQKKILEVLVQNYNRDDRFMSADEIAKEIFKDGYTKNTRKILVRDVKSRFYFVVELGFANGYTIIPKRKETAKDDTKKFIVLGWKIARAGIDEEYVNDELAFKLSRGKSEEKAYQRLIESAKKSGILVEAMDTKQISGTSLTQN